MNFSEWDLGRKLIAAGVVLAIVSFLLPWSIPHPLARLTHNGFSQGWTIAALALLLVPLVQVLRGGAVNKLVGYVCVGLAFALGLVFVLTATYDLSVRSVNVSQWGSWVFLCTTAVVGVGVFVTE